MKLGNITLSEWKKIGRTPCNFYRVAHEPGDSTFDAGYKLFVGFIINDFGKPYDSRFWAPKIIGNGALGLFLRSKIYLFQKQKYSFDELDQAKKDMDHFLLKISKLLTFS